MEHGPIRINFVLGFTEKTGGNAVILEYAYRLGKLGHDVRVYYPLLLHSLYVSHYPKWKRWPSRIRRYLGSYRNRGSGIPWFPHRLDIRPVPVIAGPFIRPADATIATACPTAYDVAKLSGRTGGKFYFVQHHETWHGDPEWVDASYRLPLGLIVIAPWLAELMRSKFRRNPDAEIHNGVDLEFFRPPAAKPTGPPSILMMYHHQEIKGIPDGLEVLRRLRWKYPQLIVRMFGLYDFPDKDDFIEYVRDPTPSRLLSLYQESHIFLCPSHSEGWHLPPMEAMACGCAPVVTDVGCIPVLKEEGDLSVVEPRDKEGLYRLASALIEDPVLCRQKADAAYAVISRHGWERPVAQLENLLVSAFSGPRTA